MSDLISIVISTYNAEAYIEETLISILAQTYHNIELVVVDDGSSDGTLQILEKYQALRKITIIKNSHTGNIGQNLNIGITESKGKYVCVCGADDVWNPDKLSKQSEYLSVYDCVTSNATIIDSKSNIIKEKFNEAISQNRALTLDELLFSNCIVASSVIVKKSLLCECGFFDEEFGNRAEDYFLWLNIASKYPIFYITNCLVRYRLHNENLSRKSFEDIEQLSLRTIDLKKKYLSYGGQTGSAARDGILYEYSRLINLCIENEKLEKASFHSKSASQFIIRKISIKYMKYFFFPLIVRISVFFKRRTRN